MWLLNGIIVAFMLVKLFIYGEPITQKNSVASVSYWRHRNQADQDSARVSFWWLSLRMESSSKGGH